MDAKILNFQKKELMSVVQFETADKNSFEYITSDFAFKKNFIEVKELSESGSVNTIVVFNNSPHFVFFMDGDILIGAKQNRVLNTSILLAPESKSAIPVSCVESGRWSYRSRNFTSSDYTAPAMMRRAKSNKVKDNLRRHGSFDADQSEVWDHVASYCRIADVKSETNDFGKIHEDRRIDLDEFVRFFKPMTDANGIAVFIKNKLLHIDIFNKTSVLNEYLPKIIRGDSIEIYRLYKADNEEVMEQAEASYKTLEFLDKINEYSFTIHKGAGTGEEKRYESDLFTGFELSYEMKTIHLSAMNLRV